jgi:MOSC domain-containing protein YiiM
MPTLLNIWIKRFHRGPMDPVDRAELVAGRGLMGNANQGGRRQVTIISSERWAEAQQALGVLVDPAARRANLLVEQLDLSQSHDRILRIGSCRFLIRGETRPCERMDEACQGLRAALDDGWGGGAYAEVLSDGWIAVGDRAEWELPQEGIAS